MGPAREGITRRSAGARLAGPFLARGAGAATAGDAGTRRARLRRVGFPDHFSAVSSEYARFRPGYPRELFDHLREAAPATRLAWDAATGSGQVAEGLIGRFDEVVATDAALAQLLSARRAGRLRYVVATCEQAPIADSSVALVTVGQALHWLDLERFYAEVRRVLCPGGVVAAWSYDLLTVDPDVDRVLRDFHDRTIGSYWPSQRHAIGRGYAALPFPFAPVSLPAVEMSARWDVERALGYLGTWSAVERFRRARGRDPVETLRPALESVWPAGEERAVRWPLTLRVGRHGAPATIGS